jgi:hypothetical protein
MADRSMVWNADLLDLLELDNMIRRKNHPRIAPSTAPKAVTPMPAKTTPSAPTELARPHPWTIAAVIAV